MPQAGKQQPLASSAQHRVAHPLLLADGFLEFKIFVSKRVPALAKHKDQPQINALIFSYWWQYKDLHPSLHGKFKPGNLPRITEEEVKAQGDWMERVNWASIDVGKLERVYQQGGSEEPKQKVIVRRPLIRINS